MLLKSIDIFFSFVFGLAVGSFLNCIIYRLYHHQSLFGRSVCPKCGHQIAWYDNIPLLSFIILRGRCRYCHQKISWQYPLVELITGILFVAAFFYRGCYLSISNNLLILLRDWLIIFAFIFIFVYDLRYLLVENAIIIPAAIIVFILNLILKVPLTKLLLAIGVSVSFFGIQYLITKGEGIGLGDLSIGLLMGASLSWPNILVGIIVAYIVGAVVGLLLVLSRKKKWESRIALGPFLAVGTIIALFYGQKIINFYLSKLY